MSVSAADHYRLTESVVSRISDLASYIAQVEMIASENGCDVYWRGQARYDWPITSSLVRRMSSDSLTDSDLQRSEQVLLTEAKTWVKVTPTPMRTNLEWLAYLQHSWLPTRLMDFTPDPLVAVFFACDTHDDTDGRLFAVLVPKTASVLDGTIDFEINDIPSRELRVFRPRPEVSPRLAAQSGVFLLGKLPSTHVRRYIYDALLDARRDMLKAEVASVMSLPLLFCNLDSELYPGKQRHIAFTARIHITKASIRSELEKNRAGTRSLKPVQTIDHAYVYPDVQGMQAYSPAFRSMYF